MAAKTDPKDIRVTRVYDAPVSVVWDAWTIPEQVATWWGPRGFTLTTHHADLRVGGSWRYTMHGPDGVDYPNVIHYFVVEPGQKLVYDHGETDDTPPHFRVSVTFEESGGKTTMDMVSTLPTPEAAAETAKFVKMIGGTSTWDRLAETLAETTTGDSKFVITRVVDAPIAEVFNMWTNAEMLVKWLPPAGTTMRFVQGEIRAGQSTRFLIEGDGVSMRFRADYLVVDAPHQLVYTQQFVDDNDVAALPPGATVWPDEIKTTVDFVAISPQQTRVTVTTEIANDASSDARLAFAHERTGMAKGWTGSFNAQDAVLDDATGKEPPKNTALNTALNEEHVL